MINALYLIWIVPLAASAGFAFAALLSVDKRK